MIELGSYLEPSSIHPYLPLISATRFVLVLDH